MKLIKATLVQGDDRFMNNLWFSTDTNIVRDNSNLCYSELRRKLFESGIDLATEDIHPCESSTIVLFVDVPRKSKYYKRRDQFWFLLLNEVHCVYPNNYKPKNHTHFDRIFTWDESIVDYLKYFQIRLAYDLNYNDFGKRFGDRKLLTMIAGAKNSSCPGSLYGLRYEVVKWFSQNHQEDFDLYGVGWPKELRPILSPRYESRLPYFVKALFGLFYPINRVYRGPIYSKRVVLSNYKFTVCYENMGNKRGLITEKIFDAMCSGSVPVYFGATNIASLIPSKCYIDARRFLTFSDFYETLNNITATQFEEIQMEIQKFLSSDSGKVFSVQTFSGLIASAMITELSLRE